MTRTFCEDGHKWSDDWYENIRPGFIVSGCEVCPALRKIDLSNIEVVDSGEWL